MTTPATTADAAEAERLAKVVADLEKGALQGGTPDALQGFREGAPGPVGYDISKHLNLAWMDPAHIPNKKWLLEVLATLKPEDEIFRKDYVAPPVRKRLRDVETIVLPDELFQNMPKSTSKVKARHLKVVSQAFAAEKTTRLKEMQKHILDEIITHEERVESYQDKLRVS
jgi:hypothetical protein